MLEPFQLPFVQHGLVEMTILAVAAGVIGTWIVLRGLAFFSHAVGTAAFPGLVLADGLAFSAHLGAAASAAGVAAGVGVLSRRDRDRHDSLTALVLVAALAIGVILASDVFHSAAGVETLLFGSLLTIGGSDIAWAAAAAVIVVAASFLLGPRWLATGFDAGAARGLGVRSALTDAVLLALVALVAVAALSAVGALLATALLVIPAATTRLFCRRVGSWQLVTVALAALEGAGGLWLSVQLNAPPGAAIAVLTGTVFALAALVRIGLARLGRRRVARVLAPALLVLALLAGCGSDGGSTTATGTAAGGRSVEPVAVVATTTQLGDIVRAIGGDAVDVTQLLQPNSDPHDYEPRPRDVQDTAAARVVFQSGDGLDHWMGEVIEQSGGDPTVVDVGDSAVSHVAGESEDEEEHAGEDEHEPSEYDPHWWHDPRNVEAAIPVIRDALIAANPSARAQVTAGADAYLAKVRTLDAGIAACFDELPEAERKLVTDHDAFGYFAQRYAIHVIGAVIPSQTTQAQPSAGDVARLSRLIRAQGVKAVFPESSVNPKLARAIAEQTGASSDHALYGDTLGPEGSDGATYLGSELHNADAMLRGFTGGAQGCTISGI